MKPTRLCRCLFVAVVVALLASCKVEHPSDVLSPKKMEAVLYDYHLAQVMCNDLNGQERYKRDLYMNYVYEKHHVTRAQVDSSLVWYARNPKELSVIYEHLNARAEAELARLSEKKAEVKRRAPLPVEGDSADIWYERRLVLLSTSSIDNLFLFTIPSDSNFHVRDKFEWTFDVMFIPRNNLLADTLLQVQNGAGPAVPSDSVISPSDSLISSSDSLGLSSDSLPCAADSCQTEVLSEILSDSVSLRGDSSAVASRYRARLVCSMRVLYANDSVVGIDTILYNNGHYRVCLQNSDSVAVREVFGSLWYKSEDGSDQVVTSTHRLARYRQHEPSRLPLDSVPCDTLNRTDADSTRIQVDSSPVMSQAESLNPDD